VLILSLSIRYNIKLYLIVFLIKNLNSSLNFLEDPFGSSYFLEDPFRSSYFLEDPFGSSYFLEDPFRSSYFLEDPFRSSYFLEDPFGISNFFPKYLLKWCKNKDKKERCHLEKTPSPTESVS